MSPCSAWSSVYNGLTSMPLEMTISFRALKHWKHCILIYIFARFHACRPICTILSLFHVQNSSLAILTSMPLQRTIGISTLIKWNHHILSYICAKFYACRPICTILSWCYVQYCPVQQWTERYVITNVLMYICTQYHACRLISQCILCSKFNTDHCPY